MLPSFLNIYIRQDSERILILPLCLKKEPFSTVSQHHFVCICQKVLVEYDNEDWTTREWLKIHDGSWKLFLVEQTMVWSQRPDPANPRRPLLWPALVRVQSHL